MQPVIEIKNIGKKYTRNEVAAYLSLRESITEKFTGLFKQKNHKHSFWALDDVSFNVAAGDRVGIIGRNGAGKTTLLKLISRITPPTKGHIVLRGRVGSLLEVGTGFHPELTGRENIYLNGSILGLRRNEITKKFDEIVDFSGVEKFIDTPLKKYSSGMQLRLAFSVAAHLEPEILLIDEVLAVGDVEFHKKCIGKMQEVSRSDGRTILFVSHNMSYISSLCNQAVLLDHGKMISSGTSSKVIGEYISSIANRSANQTWNENQPGNDIVKLLSVQMINQEEKTTEDFAVNESIGIKMNYQVLQDGHVLWLGHNIHNQEGINVFDTHSVDHPLYNQKHPVGKFEATTWVPKSLLNTGTYLVSTAIFNHTDQVIHLHEKDVILFNVHEVFDEMTARGNSPGDFPGVIRPMLKWQIEKVSE